MDTTNTNIQHDTTPSMRVLIVGAGIAGLTLAGLLEKRGLQPVVVEKQTEENFNKSGYMIGLMPLGGRVFNALGLREAYLKNSIAVDTYSMHDGKGRQLNHFDMKAISDYGQYQGISRPRLIELLLAAYTQKIRYGTTVTAIKENEISAEVTFSTGETEQFDLVVIADGIHSATRELAFGPKNHKYRQTGWGGWAWFADMPPQLANAYREYWAGRGFMGLYTVEDNKVGVFLGGPMKDIKKAGHELVAKNTIKHIKNSDIDIAALLEPLVKSPDLFFWDFHDVRSENWRTKHTVLLGDAANGFLPTAGIGASMAMDSAAALDDELSRTDLEHLSFALRLYENRQKKRVIMAQDNSRTLGSLMFLKNRMLSWIRNQVLRFYTIDMFLKDIKKVMEGK